MVDKSKIIKKDKAGWFENQPAYIKSYI